MASRWFPGDEVSFRPRSAWWYAALVALLVIPTAVSALVAVTARTPAVLLSAAAVGLAAWCYFVRPHVRVTDDAVTVVNPWRVHVVPWAALVDVDTRFALTLVTADRRIQAAGAPSPGGMAALRSSRGGSDPDLLRQSRQQVVGIRPGDLASSDSGQAARIIRGHWQDLVEDGVLDGARAADAAARSSWSVPLLVATVVLALAALVAWAVTG